MKRPSPVFSPVLILMLLSTFALKARTAPAGTFAPPPEIEPALLEALEAHGSANLMVVMMDQADLSAAYHIQDWEARGWYVYNTLYRQAMTSQGGVVALAQAHDLDYRQFIAVNTVYIAGADRPAVEALARLEGVARLELERPVWIEPAIQEAAAEGPEAYGWNLDKLNPASSQYGMQAAQVWGQYGVRGEGIVVGTLDTGVMFDHEALVAQYRGKLGGGTFDHNYNWWDPINGGAAPYDDHGHGSGTTGIMVGETPDLAEQIGVAPGGRWIACKGLTGDGVSSNPNILECFDFLLAPWDLSYTGPGTGNPDPARRPHVINNSWGSGECSTTYQTAIQAWVAAGQFPAFSAGNTVACGALRSPGDNPEAFGSAAHDSTGDNLYAGGPSCFFPDPSCDPEAHQVDPHLNAPTFGRTATNSQGAYYNLSGTSGASPHTAGTVALVWSGNPDIIGDVYGTCTLLEQSANHDVPLGDCGKPACAGSENWPNYEYGWGYLDALAAVTLAGVREPGTLEGRVTEQGSGEPLAGISVSAQRMGGGVWSTLTHAAGTYSLTLANGTFTVTAEGPQHAAATVSGVMIVTDTVTTQDLQLEPLGLLHGTVTDVEGGAPLEATITVSGEDPLTTDPATGSYSLYLAAGSYAVTAEATNYASQTVTVTVTAGESTQQDFALQWIEPRMGLTPTAFDIELPVDLIYTETLSITNEGPGDLIWEIRETTRTVTASIPPFEGLLAPGAPASAGRAPHAPAPGGAAVGIPFPLAGEPAFAMEVYPEDNLVYFPDTTAPGSWVIIGNLAGSSFFAGDFLGGDLSLLYAVDAATNMLYAVDTATAMPIALGLLAPGAGESWSGMTGAAGGILYASATTCASSTLYRIDLARGTAGPVGPITNGPCIIDIAINAEGELYGVDIANDVLVGIDPATAAGTVVGSIGFDANYAQGMDFEEPTGLLYLAAYNGSTRTGELRIANTANGATTVVGPFPGGAEVDCLAFATVNGGARWVDVPWVTEVPTSGVTLAGGSSLVEVVFDTHGLTGGECYTASLGLIHNDPGWDSPVMIPLQLCVGEPPWQTLYLPIAFRGH